MSGRLARSGLVLIVAATVVAAMAPDAGARWVIRGHGWGHGTGMSQWGARGYATHGRGYRWILHHYYRRTTIGHTKPRRLRVLLGTAQHSIDFTKANRACGRRVDPDRTYLFTLTGGKMVLRRRSGKRLEVCGRSAAASGKRTVSILDGRDYRGAIVAKASGGHMLVINHVGLEAYVRGVVPNESPSSWPEHALRAQAVAARSYALATRGGGAFDLYDDTRSQVYGGADSETRPTNRATKATARQVARSNGHIATTYFFSTSGGMTESVQFAFPGAEPQPYLKGVRDRYDRASPEHSWRFRLSQRRMESRLSGLFSGRLKRIKVLKTGASPRIVRARVVGSRGSSRVRGTTLQSRLNLKSTWVRFRNRAISGGGGGGGGGTG